MRKKKFLLFLLIGILVFCLASCGGKQDGQSSDGGSGDSGNTEEAQTDDNSGNNKTDTEDQEQTYRCKVPYYESIEEEAQWLIPYDYCRFIHLDLTKDSLTVDDLSATDKANMAVRVFGFYDVDFLNDEEEQLLLTVSRDDFKRYFKDISFLDSYDESVLITPYKLTPVDSTKEMFYVTTYPCRCEQAENERYYLFFKESKTEGTTLKLEYFYCYGVMTMERVINEKEGISTIKYHLDIYTDIDRGVHTQRIENDLPTSDIDLTALNTMVFSFDTSNDNLRFVKMEKQFK